MNKNVEQYNIWKSEQYLNLVGILDNQKGSRIFEKFMARFPNHSHIDNNHRLCQGLTMMTQFLSLKTNCLITTSGYDNIIVRITYSDNSGNTITANFGSAYWDKGTGELFYVCVSPTFESKDGEFRHFFLRYKTFTQMYKETNMVQFSDIEDFIFGLMKLQKIYLDVASYPNDEIRTKVENSRILLLILVWALARDVYKMDNNMMARHTSKYYTEMLKCMMLESPEIIKLCQPVTEENKEFYCLKSAIGQKIVPMTIHEITDAYNYDFSAWRELLAMKAVGDLVINFITPSFPLFIKHTILDNYDSGCFENESMKQKYKKSQDTLKVMKLLTDARKELNEIQEQQYIVGFSNKIFDSIEFAQSYLKLSNASILYIMQDIGTTIDSLRANPEVYINYGLSEQPGNVFKSVFSSMDFVGKYLFDILYGCHCSHTRIGLIHTDLHLNNIVLNDWSPPRTRIGDGVYREWYKNPAMVYIFGSGGQDDTYLFPTKGSTGSIIDFSRSIFGPMFRPYLEEDQSEKKADLFYHNQVNRIMRVFDIYAHDFVLKHQDKIRGFILTDFENVFRALSAVDFIAVGSVMGNAFGGYEMAEEKAFCSKLEYAGREALIIGLQNVIANKPNAFVGFSLLPKIFGRWSFPNWEKNRPDEIEAFEFVDVFSYQNEMKYSSDKYEKWPYWARHMDMEKSFKNAGLDIDIEKLFHNIKNVVTSNYERNEIDIIADRLRVEEKKLFGDEKYIIDRSSWFEE